MRLFLSGQPRYDLIGEAENIDQLMRLVAKRRPDVIVIEQALIMTEQVEVIRFLEQYLLRERMLIMTDDLTDRLYDHDLVMLCSKQAAPETVLQALKRSWVDREIHTRSIDLHLAIGSIRFRMPRTRSPPANSTLST